MIVISLVPLQDSPVPTVSPLTTITGHTSLLIPAVRRALRCACRRWNRRSRRRHPVELRTRSNAGFLHPLRFRVTAIGLAGLEHGARHVVAHQVGQVGGALQQAVEIDAGV